MASYLINWKDKNKVIAKQAEEKKCPPKKKLKPKKKKNRRKIFFKINEPGKTLGRFIKKNTAYWCQGKKESTALLSPIGIK